MNSLPSLLEITLFWQWDTLLWLINWQKGWTSGWISQWVWKTLMQCLSWIALNHLIMSLYAFFWTRQICACDYCNSSLRKERTVSAFLEILFWGLSVIKYKLIISYIRIMMIVLFCLPWGLWVFSFNIFWKCLFFNFWFADWVLYGLFLSDFALHMQSL